MSGVLGGSQKTSTKIPEWLAAASQDALGRADDISQIGYAPYMGPEVAAFNEAQQAAFGNNRAMARDLGLTASVGPVMPPPTDFGGGVMGYGSHDGYKRNLEAFKEAYPGQYEYMRSFFIDPETGQLRQRGEQTMDDRSGMVDQRSYEERARDRAQEYYDNDRGGIAGGYNNTLADVTGRRSGAGFTSFRDMFDGGGAGASGGAFEGGGLLSNLANRAGLFGGRRGVR